MVLLLYFKNNKKYLHSSRKIKHVKTKANNDKNKNCKFHKKTFNVLRWSKTSCLFLI